MTAAYNFVINTGAVVADTSTLLADVQAEYKAALGQTLNLAASTPQGTLIAAEVIARTNVMQNNAEVANMTNPDLSYGTFLDAICSLLGITRGTNQSTVGTPVVMTTTVPNVTIPAGSRVQTTNGDIFVTAAAVTLAIPGTINATIQSQQYGAIPLPVGSLTILDGTIGWASAAVTGGTVVTLGALALQDAQLKNLRRQTLAQQGIGSSAAILAAILSVPNVTSAQVVENNTGATGVVNGVNFTLSNAMWVCVAGTPTDAALAQALYSAHNGGCPWDYGTSSGNAVGSPNGKPATDPATGLIYNVKWTTPVLYDCYVNITVHQAQSVASPIPAVQNAIMNYATGQEQGENGLVIGANVSAFEVAGAVARQLPGVYVKSCMVACVTHGSAAPSYPSGYTSEFVMSQFGLAVLAIGNIQVTPV
jgi:uncharacterized phage protein gp47/JayE